VPATQELYEVSNMRIYAKYYNICRFVERILTVCLAVIALMALINILNIPSSLANSNQIDQNQPKELNTIDKVLVWGRGFDVKGSIEYIELLLNLSAEKYGPYKIVKVTGLEQGRAVSELRTGRLVNTAIFGMDATAEKSLLPVYYPVDRGLLGLRVCIIRAGDTRFDSVSNIKDLVHKNLAIGVGTHWPDRKILQANQVPIVTSAVYHSLFQMLAQRRFDCFARSLNEVENEMFVLDPTKFAIEKDLAIIYPLSNMLYVSPKYPQLHERLNYGLEQALKTNALTQHYQEHYAEIIQRLHFFSRKLVILGNPDLSKKSRQIMNQYGLISFEQSH